MDYLGKELSLMPFIVLQEARNSNKYFHEDNMAVTVGNLFAAGTETTSTTLRWGLLLMMKYPHIQAIFTIKLLLFLLVFQLYNMFPFLGCFLSDHKKVQTNRIMFEGYVINTYKDRKDSVDSNDLKSFIDTFISRQREELYNMFPFLGCFLSDHKKVQTNRIMFEGYVINTYKDRKDSVDSNDLKSFIDTFISRQREEEARNSNKYFHEDNMAVTVGNLFAAGTETTSTTLRWGLLLMMKYPHIQVSSPKKRKSHRSHRSESSKQLDKLWEMVSQQRIMLAELLHDCTATPAPSAPLQSRSSTRRMAARGSAVYRCF
ncbi:UNVERIFIED_CONTAM: hypothetical protein FKN15_006175 [Acipenser sinensis]